MRPERPSQPATYLVHAALVARPAAALALDVLLHEADLARRAAERRRRPVGRVAQLELNFCGEGRSAGGGAPNDASLKWRAY